MTYLAQLFLIVVILLLAGVVYAVGPVGWTSSSGFAIEIPILLLAADVGDRVEVLSHDGESCGDKGESAKGWGLS